MDNSPMPGQYARHSHHSSSLSGHDSPSASSVASQTLVPPPSSFFSGVPPPRSQGLPEPLPPASTASRSPVGYGGPEYGYRPYGTSSGSPSSVAGSSIHESLGSADLYGTAGISPTHLAANSLSAQKRAYRQRRKDPSCDACRERKVKCDATETSSCSECSSRSVKCQFTKETNRRMSSIKQVQDLQHQLAEKDEQIKFLQAQLQQKQQIRVETPLESPLDLPPIGVRRKREDGPPVLPNFDHIRRDMKTYSRGVFKVPPSYRDMMPTPDITTKEILLPPRHVTNQLLAQYHSHLHRHAPMIHWTSFSQQVDRIYAHGDFQGCTQIWVASFFGVLANGTLQSIDTSVEGVHPERDGMKYITWAARLCNTWTDNLTIDHARCFFLLSTALVEMNIKDAGWIYLGSAVRTAQEIGLNLEVGPWTPLELEARRRVAWTIFGYDRLHSLEGKPLTIIEEDFIGPSGFPKDRKQVDEQWMLPHPREYPLSPVNSVQAHATSALMMHIVRMVEGLRKTMKAKVIPAAVSKQYDDYFRQIQASYPDKVQPHVDSYLDPFSVSVSFSLMAAWFILFRHNINIYAQPHERTDAINRILSVAQDSARLISRTMHPAPTSPNNSPYSGPSTSWRDRMKSQASNGICRHIWRCTLVLAFRGDYDAALICVRASGAIGSMRKHNIACGRYLSHFLDKLQERVERGLYSQQSLEADDEMVALMTGDMQGHVQDSWIWAGSEKRAYTAPSPLPLEATTTLNRRQSNGASTPDLPYTPLLSEKESNDWGGFERLERVLETIKEEQQRHERRYQEGHAYYQPPQNSAKRLHLAPPDPPNPPTTQQQTPSAASTTGSGGSTPVGASRISIANII